MVLGALADAGGQEWLAEQAKKNPVAFMSLLGRVLPLTVAGDPNAPVKLVVSWVDPEDEAGQPGDVDAVAKVPTSSH